MSSAFKVSWIRHSRPQVPELSSLFGGSQASVHQDLVTPFAVGDSQVSQCFPSHCLFHVLHRLIIVFVTRMVLEQNTSEELGLVTT